MKPYSNDLRTQIVKAYESGPGSMRDLAFNFGVSLSFVNYIIQRHRQVGSVEPKRYKPGPPPKVGEHLHPVLKDLVSSDNDATLQEYCDQLYEKAGIRVSVSKMGQLLQKLHLRRKKKISTQQSKIQSG